MKLKSYSGEQLNEVRMPLGGIGAGCVSLNAAGRLVDWEISGYANKNSNNGFTHFAIKAEDGRGGVWARALQGDEPGGRMGAPQGGNFGCYGFGQARETLGGLPHFPEGRFEAAWPVARLGFGYAGFPGRVQLEAFSPFIPLDSAMSSLPAAFFEWEVANTTSGALDYTICFSVTNPFDPAGTTNRYTKIGEADALVLENKDWSLPVRKAGSLAVSVLGEGRASWQEYWYRGSWFDGLQVFWKDFTSPGPMRNRRYGEPAKGGADTASLAVTKRVEAGERWRVRYILNWYVPYMENDWSPMPAQEACGDGCCCGGKRSENPNRWRKWYAVQYPSAEAVAQTCIDRYDALKERTCRFVGSVTGSTLPEPVTDAALSTLASLVTPLCLRLSDGSFYGWEGLHSGCGCCEGSCTHVWNYAYALCYLFPDLERSMRDLDFLHNMDEDGGMRFRLQLPPGRKPWSFIPCADGQFGGVVKLWRDYLICGDRQWLAGHWPRVRKMLGYAWSPANACRWDPDKTGVLTGRQHHTLDMELFGPNSWLTGMYLAALKAAARMAELLEDREAAAEYGAIFERGSRWAAENLFNGEYFYHRIDLNDKETLRPYADESAVTGGAVEQSYWDGEHGELKYQIGEGCAIDQVLGQWHANLCGLGEIFPEGQVNSALDAVYRHNFLPTVRDFFNPCRLYCVNDEGGTLICSYPEGRRRPVIPVPYCEETMHGFEYQAACHMVQQGRVERGAELVKAVRDRYDGRYRNPFNEIECGSNYARSMASFALLPSFAGMTVDMGRGRMRFNPVVQGDFRCFFSVADGWGEFERKGNATTIRVLEGCLRLQSLELPYLNEVSSVRLNGKGLAFTRETEGVAFASEAIVEQGGELMLE